MSKKKAGGKTGQHVSPSGKRLGVKVTAGQTVSSGEVLIRQRGTSIKPGSGVKSGRDHTIYSTVSGVVKFGQKLGRKVISVVS